MKRSTSRNDRASILSILDSIARINEYIVNIAGPTDYYENKLVFDATLMNFINIGEMANRLSEDLRIRHAELDWQKIKSFRNLVVHDYLGVDAEEVWQITKTDLPELNIKLASILEKL